MLDKTINLGKFTGTVEMLIMNITRHQQHEIVAARLKFTVIKSY